MKINLTQSDLAPPKQSRRLPGERHPFKERSSIRNLTPPQQLAPNGAVVSARDREVSHIDPLLQRIRELEAEIVILRQQLTELLP